MASVAPSNHSIYLSPSKVNHVLACQIILNDKHHYAKLNSFSWSAAEPAISRGDKKEFLKYFRKGGWGEQDSPAGVILMIVFV